MSWERKKLKVKQPGIEKEEDMMSRHLDAVVTSTLNQKQSRHQLANRTRSRQHQLKKEGRDISQRSRHQSEVATAVVKKRGRNNTWLSRQQFHRKEVATTPGCRDINCEDLRSRQHLVVATTIAQNRRSRQHLAVTTFTAKTRRSRHQ